MKQEFTSKNTSINTKKLPAIYNKIDWEKCRGKIVFDYGCGKQETINLIQELLEPYDIDYIGLVSINNIDKIVFSSTAATYGNPEKQLERQ